ncbi:uncharacterized protein K02A2.6-like [Photinus pyralis]|uniref:uncharacterized protein K02A2.6-like n=1 Tax=Photinus pyralis TaxID=7054 RepID=UPI0012670C82|nr:uncharacterized protein K02A2.6-like isoform X2 [Photinus pyralis]XP_031354753.1 uncharacterized protein K02A2.6-like [Photinus pyralis]
MEFLTAPVPIFNMQDDASSMGSRWEKWLNRFENYLLAAGIDNEERQKAMLLHYAVNREFEIFNFRQCKQEENEVIDTFYTRLLKLSKTCSFTNTNEEIKSQIIMKTKYTQLRKYGLTEQPSLDDLLARGRTIEATRKQLAAIEDEHKQIEKCNRMHQNKNRSNTSQKNRNPDQNRDHQIQSKCKNCGGTWHTNGRQSCPAYQLNCRSCGKIGHFAKVCMSKGNQRPQHNTRNSRTHTQRARVNFNETQNQEEFNSDHSETSFQITTIQKVNKVNLPTTQVKLNGTSVDFIIDTGSSINLINAETYKNLGIHKLLPDNTTILPYNTMKRLELVGKFKGKFVHNKSETEADVYVVQGDGEALLSYETSVKLNLIHVSLNNKTISEISLSEYPNLTKGIGNLKHVKVMLHIDETITPVAHKHRRIPIHLRKAVEAELKRLEQQDIIEKATGPTPWVSPIVIIPRTSNPNQIRLCVDMREANKAIKRERHPTPTIDDILSELNGATTFSKIDLKDGYHQLTLHENSRYITVFSTHAGLYRYKRLSFGINSAAEIFQNIIRQTLINIQGVINVSDDILIYGKSKEKHDQALRIVLERLNANNLTINLRKCVLNKDKIKFFGYVFSKDGVHPDPEKIKSVVNLETPTNVHEVRSLLGILNYVGKFLPNLATNTQVLRELTNKRKKWEWSDAHEKAFKFLKKQLSNAQKLAYFDVNKNTHLYVDAGPIGLGAILSQEANNKTEIIAYASRTLTQVEQRYSQIEKETLAATWAIQHFHIYLYGTTFTLHTDHKPLLSILSNPQSSPSARIERLCLRTQPYQFKIVHQPGVSNPSDYLSRHPTTDEGINKNDKIEEYVYFIAQNSMPKTMTVEEVRQKTQEDALLNKLKEALQNNDYKLWENPQLKPYKSIKEELTIYQGVVLRKNRILIPTSMQERVIQLAHKGHLGIVKTKQLLRTKVWFANMNEMVDKYVKSCHACQAVTPFKQRNPLETTEMASHAFGSVDVDYAGPFPNGKYAFLLIDEYSRFPIVEIIPSTNFKHLKAILDKTFAIFGIRQKLKSDNGPPFNGKELKSYLSSMHIKHHPITPYWPEANGVAERFVKTLKKSLLCAFLETHDMEAQLQEFLINYRSSPHQTTEKSPYELIFNREVNTFLPSIIQTGNSNYNPSIEHTKRETRNNKANIKRRTKPHTFTLGDKVLCKQIKHNSLTPYYDPYPWKITRITGAQIEGEREGRKIIRNSSFFKSFIPRTNPSNPNSPSLITSPNPNESDTLTNTSLTKTTKIYETPPNGTIQEQETSENSMSTGTMRTRPSIAPSNRTPTPIVTPSTSGHEAQDIRHPEASPPSFSNRPKRQTKTPGHFKDYVVTKY